MLEVALARGSTIFRGMFGAEANLYLRLSSQDSRPDRSNEAKPAIIHSTEKVAVSWVWDKSSNPIAVLGPSTTGVSGSNCVSAWPFLPEGVAGVLSFGGARRRPCCDGGVAA